MEVALKTIIATYALGRADLIPLQYACLKKFVVGDFEYLVFNNSAEGDPAINAIEQTCRQIGVRCIRVTERIDQLGSVSHGQALDWSLKNHIFATPLDYVLILDFDMFLLEALNIKEFMADSDVAGIPQSRQHVSYLWPGLLFMKLAGMPNLNSLSLNCHPVDGVNVDSGGDFAIYAKDNPGIKIKHLNHTSHITTKEHFSSFFRQDMVDKYDPAMCFEVYIRKFLHYGCGSNWNGASRAHMDAKSSLLFEIVRRCLSGDNVFKG
jgi:hypothetical protein